jgi:hypothetical protein
LDQAAPLAAKAPQQISTAKAYRCAFENFLIEVPDAQIDAEGRLLTLQLDRKFSICAVAELAAGDVLHLDQPAHSPTPG